MRYSHRPKPEFPEQRLGIAQFAGAGRGIAHVPDGSAAGKFLAEHSGIEDLADQAHSGVAAQLGSVAGNDTGRFLTAMLLRENSLIDNLRGIGRAPDPEESALFFLLVFVKDRKGKTHCGSPKEYGIEACESGQMEGDGEF
jgi:hypothetical protein